MTVNFPSKITDSLSDYLTIMEEDEMDESEELPSILLCNIICKSGKWTFPIT